MSVFALIGKIFGGKERDKSQTTGKAIQSLDETEKLLKKKHGFHKKKVDNEMAVARKNAKTNKKMAMNALKKKQRYEKQLQQIQGTVTRLEQQRKQISEAISIPVASGQDLEEDELQAELGEFVQVADQLPETPLEEPAATVTKPAHVPKRNKNEEEDPDAYCRISSLGSVKKQNCLNCGFKVYGRGNSR